MKKAKHRRISADRFWDFCRHASWRTYAIPGTDRRLEIWVDEKDRLLYYPDSRNSLNFVTRDEICEQVEAFNRAQDVNVNQMGDTLFSSVYFPLLLGAMSKGRKATRPRILKALA